MDHFVVGIVPAPELPTTIAYKLSGHLEYDLEEHIPGDTSWKIEVETDQLTGAAEKVKDIMDQALYLKKENGWDYVISLTDLPIFHGKFAVLADADEEDDIAQVSLPAFGAAPTVGRVKKTLLQMVKEMHYRHTAKGQDPERGIGATSKSHIEKAAASVKNMFTLSKIKRQDLG